MTKVDTFNMYQIKINSRRECRYMSSHINAASAYTREAARTLN